MVTDILITIFVYFLKLFSLLPSFHLWPATLLEGLQYFVNAFMKLNIFFPVDTFFQVINSLIYFYTLLIGAKIFAMILNYFRGTGKGIEI